MRGPVPLLRCQRLDRLRPLHVRQPLLILGGISTWSGGAAPFHRSLSYPGGVWLERRPKTGGANG